jgi:hypothetical protein
VEAGGLKTVEDGKVEFNACIGNQLRASARWIEQVYRDDG